MKFTACYFTFKDETLANTRLVSDSATAILAPQAASTSPLIGCSPMAVAEPVVVKWERAVTATSASGVWRGPTHCCWATRPVTERSTWVRKNINFSHVTWTRVRPQLHFFFTRDLTWTYPALIVTWLGLALKILVTWVGLALNTCHMLYTCIKHYQLDLDLHWIIVTWLELAIKLFVAWLRLAQNTCDLT